jgi:hypothetical protein
MKLRLFLASSALLVAVVACSGASSTELFGPAGSSQFGTEPGPTENPSGAGSSSPNLPAPSHPDPGSGGSSSGSTSSGGPEDAGKDASPPTNNATIFCGKTNTTTTTCNAKTEVCCGSWNGGWGGPNFECEPAGVMACAGGTKIACDESSDCPTGQICCGSLDNSGYTDVACRPTCNSTPGIRAVRFCNPDATTDECAAVGQYCGNSQSLPGFHVCRD